jgi:hypothetical protein
MSGNGHKPFALDELSPEQQQALAQGMAVAYGPRQIMIFPCPANREFLHTYSFGDIKRMAICVLNEELRMEGQQDGGAPVQPGPAPVRKVLTAEGVPVDQELLRKLRGRSH